jgi:CBS domain-containing protein
MTRTIQDVMTRTVVVVPDSAPFKEIVGLMDEYRVSALPVVNDEGRISGIVSEGDLLLKEELAAGDGRVFEGRRARRDRTKARGLTAADVMTSPVITIGPGATLAQAARLMHHNRVKRLPVVDPGGKILGIVSRADLLKVFLRPDEEIRRDVVDGLIRRTLLLDQTRVGVGVSEGVVTLEGQMERASLVPVLVGLVRGVDGVVGVNDRLTFEVDDVTRQADVVTPWGVYAPSLRPRT